MFLFFKEINTFIIQQRYKLYSLKNIGQINASFLSHFVPVTLLQLFCTMKAVQIELECTLENVHCLWKMILASECNLLCLPLS